MTLDRNIDSALRAKQHTDRTLPIGSSNKLSDQFQIPPAIFCVQPSRWSSEDVSGRSNLEQIRAIAERAAQWGCGNCEEHASVAFVFLERDGTRPIDYVQLPNHAFVVVGRDRNSNPTDYRTWGSEAAVCDPWDGQVYAAVNIPTRMFRGKKRELKGKAGLDDDEFQIRLIQSLA